MRRSGRTRCCRRWAGRPRSTARSISRGRACWRKYGVELIGASREAIDKAEDREKFKTAMGKIGLESPRSALAHSMEEALQIEAGIGFPVVIGPRYARRHRRRHRLQPRGVRRDLRARLRGLTDAEVLIEESVSAGKSSRWRWCATARTTCIIVCSIENLDPMGVHTGDSITVAPAQTLTDKEYQVMRDASIAVLREIGVDTGGSNVQFAINPDDGRMLVIEMNPRVSRSSAARVEGDRLSHRQGGGEARRRLHARRDRQRGHRRRHAASFEPTIDYVVTKVPRFAFEKFPQANDRLTTQMKSVGEVMAIRAHLPGVVPEGAARPRGSAWTALNQRTRDRETLEKGSASPALSASGTSAMRSRTASRSRKCTA